MPDNKNTPDSFHGSFSSKLYICLFSSQAVHIQFLIKFLSSDRYNLKDIYVAQEFIEFVQSNQEQIDCIILVNSEVSRSILRQLWELKILLPTIIVEISNSTTTMANSDDISDDLLSPVNSVPTCYHSAEILLYPTQIDQINSYVNLAITKFLNLAPSCNLDDRDTRLQVEFEHHSHKSLLVQQRRLAEKLKARLGYLGVYYKRNQEDFYNYLAPEEKDKLLEQLATEYRQIILNYFIDDPQINQLIDRFVDRAFFSDISVSQILEIHMELMDEFAQQLKIEGRSEEILLDYRLALIDIIAHLCEMYRRSIPGKDISLDLLFRVE
ncbi:MAG: circadian clock protein KaiA [Pleurocapsa sp.]